jgi:carboxyl-terminal processing protease
MLAELKKPQNLKQQRVYIDIDREKAPYFKTSAEQQNHWQKMLVSQLINLTISKEEEQAKQKALESKSFSCKWSRFNWSRRFNTSTNAD